MTLFIAAKKDFGGFSFSEIIRKIMYIK